MDFDYNPTQTFAYVSNQGGIYKIKTAHFVLDPDGSDIAMAGVATVGKSYFGVAEVPVFSFGRTSSISTDGSGRSKNQACADFGYSISQRSVLGAVAESTKEFLMKLSSDQWTPINFNPIKREVCIQIDTRSGMNNIVVTLLSI